MCPARSVAHGPHYCLGVAIARLVGEVGILALAECCTDLALIGDHVTWLPGFASRGPTDLPITFRAA